MPPVQCCFLPLRSLKVVHVQELDNSVEEGFTFEFGIFGRPYFLLIECKPDLGNFISLRTAKKGQETHQNNNVSYTLYHIRLDVEFLGKTRLSRCKPCLVLAGRARTHKNTSKTLDVVQRLRKQCKKE